MSMLERRSYACSRVCRRLQPRLSRRHGPRWPDSDASPAGRRREARVGGRGERPRAPAADARSAATRPREGYFENGVTRPGGTLDQLFALPAELLDGRQKDGFAYPVAIYDHRDGQAITGGYAYDGRIAALRGKFVFGDITRGRVFAADVAAMKKADDGVPRADLHISISRDGELLLTSRQDGMVRMLVPEGAQASPR